MSGRLSGGVFGRSHTSRSWKWESCGLIPRLSSYGMAIASATRSHSATSSSARCSRATIRSYRSAQDSFMSRTAWADGCRLNRAITFVYRLSFTTVVYSSGPVTPWMWNAPGRVHDRGERQPVHERDGAVQPATVRQVQPGDH